MADSQALDEAILNVATGSWRKVASVVVRACERLHTPADDALYHFVAERIAALVADGRLTARGNVADWRHSEVRLP